MPVVVDERKLGGPSICIIGAGFSGLCGAIKLIRDVGTNNFEIFEMNKDVGGTWFSNKYPGCACDIPIHGYCFTFEKRADWRAQYATYGEISKYLQEVSAKYDLYSKTRFEHSVQRLEWDTAQQQWIVTIKSNTGNVYKKNFDVVLSATGSIRVPDTPEEFKGFKGPILHTGMWDDSVNLIDRRVAVVGVGASGVQVIPQVAKVASKLVVFQRKPSWILPKFDFEFGRIAKFLFRYIPFLLYFYNILLFSMFELLWHAMKKNSWASKQFTKICNYHRRSQLGDRQDLYNLLTPSYVFGCQRTAFASDYYPVFTKPNTSLVTQKIVSVKADSILTEDGEEHQIDVLVLATGYRITDYFAPMEIIDKNGDNVLKKWKKDTPSLFIGIASHLLPNLFILYGPNTSTGHNSVVITVEMQMDWVAKVLKKMIDRDAKVVSIKESMVENYMEELRTQCRLMVWQASLCNPWYTDEQGRNVSIYPWNLTSLGKRVRNFDYDQLEFKNFPQGQK